MASQRTVPLEVGGEGHRSCMTMFRRATREEEVPFTTAMSRVGGEPRGTWGREGGRQGGPRKRAGAHRLAGVRRKIFGACGIDDWELLGGG